MCLRGIYTETTTTTTSTITASFWYARDFSARLAKSRSQAAPVGPGKIETALARTKSIQRALHGDYYFFFCDYGFVLVCVRVIRTDFSARLATYGRSMREREISPRKRALSLSLARARARSPGRTISKARTRDRFQYQSRSRLQSSYYLNSVRI